MPKAAVITVSDRCSRGQSVDASGPAVRQFLETNGFQVVALEIVPDEVEQIQAMLIRLCATAELVVTTGGTGMAARDVTPEATRGVCTRLVEGIAERMRAEGAKKTPLAALSRALCGIRGQSLILNLPGSPTAAVESLVAVLGLLPHALDLLRGKTAHSS